MVSRRSSSECIWTGVGIVQTKRYRSNPLSWEPKSSWTESGTEEIQSRSDQVHLEGLTLSAFGVPPVLLIAGWAAGAFKFWTGYRNTTYGDALMTKATITALWPILFLLSKTFRGNFKRALKG